MLLYPTAATIYVVSYLKFLLLLLNKLSFSDTTVIEGGRERKHRWDLKSFILGDTLQLITPLPRTGMFSKIWRAILVEVAGPKAPHWIILQTSHLSRTIIYFYKTPPSRGHVLYLIEQSYIFTKLHPQEGMSYIWLVKGNLQAPPLTIPLPI